MFFQTSFWSLRAFEDLGSYRLSLFPRQSWVNGDSLWLVLKCDVLDSGVGQCFKKQGKAWILRKQQSLPCQSSSHPPHEGVADADDGDECSVEFHFRFILLMMWWWWPEDCAFLMWHHLHYLSPTFYLCLCCLSLSYYLPGETFRWSWE